MDSQTAQASNAWLGQWSPYNNSGQKRKGRSFCRNEADWLEFSDKGMLLAFPGLPYCRRHRFFPQVCCFRHFRHFPVKPHLTTIRKNIRKPSPRFLAEVVLWCARIGRSPLDPDHPSSSLVWPVCRCCPSPAPVITTPSFSLPRLRAWRRQPVSPSEHSTGEGRQFPPEPRQLPAVCSTSQQTTAHPRGP